MKIKVAAIIVTVFLAGISTGLFIASQIVRPI